jgi:hypothetical protein
MCATCLDPATSTCFRRRFRGELPGNPAKARLGGVRAAHPKGGGADATGLRGWGGRPVGPPTLDLLREGDSIQGLRAVARGVECE